MIDIGKIIKIESDNRPDLVQEKSGAVGLMQILPVGGALDDWNFAFVDRKFEPKDLLNPYVNMLIGIWYLFVQLPRIFHRKGINPDDQLLLIGYNWGPGNAIKWWNNDRTTEGLPKETQDYIKKYMNLK